VGSRDINASLACANIGTFVAAAFIRSEPNAAVASVTNVTSFRTRRRLRRRISCSAGCRTWRDSNHCKCCYAASWGPRLRTPTRERNSDSHFTERLEMPPAEGFPGHHGGLMIDGRGEDNSTEPRARGSRVPQRYNITYFNLICVHLGCWSSQLFRWWIGYREETNKSVRRSMANGRMYRETPREPHS
jgi:hypothetical protein